MLNNSYLNILSSRSQDSSESKEHYSQAEFIKPTFEKLKLSFAAEDKTNYDINDIIDRSITVSAKTVIPLIKFIDFYQKLTSNIESLNTGIATNINSQVVDPLSSSINAINTTIGSVDEGGLSLIEQINQIRDGMLELG